MADGRAELDGSSLAALILAVVAWMGFAAAFFLASDPFLFLLVALVAGIAALVLSVRARRGEAAAAAAGATAAGAALLYGLTVAAVLTAMIYATGILLFLILLIFLGVMSTPQSSGSGCSVSSGSSGGGGCCDGCCDGCCNSACDCGCGNSCGGCDCGGCGGCGGGCGCIALGFVAAPAVTHRRSSWPEQLAHVLRHGIAHHPRTPEYARDVYRIGSARWCIGCFTTYPVFLGASAVLILLAPAWDVALWIGAPLAVAQAISSAGLAKRAWVKALVKASLGLGLALVVSGIHSAPWPPAAKLGVYLAVFALAWLSAVPRARRMRRAGAIPHQGCARDGSTPPAR